jgi:exodeoxyribonuclease VII large subunit
LVQGAEAAQSIAFRIEQANLLSDCDVLLITRGGGSIEDLMPFSEEVVLEAIHESTIPTVSAIGHEIDWALSDFVADLRAPTPSAAAELISKGIYDSKTELVRLKQRLVAAIEHQLLRAEVAVGKVSIPSLKAYLLTQVDRRQFRLANAQLALSGNIEDQLTHKRNRLTLLTNQLNALSPLAILERGFALVSTEEGSVLRSSRPVRDGDRLKIRWIDGERSVRVEEQDEL